MARGRRTLIFVVSGVLVLAFAVLLILVAVFDADRYRDLLIAHLGRTLGRSVEAEKLSLEFIPLRLRLEELRIGEADEFPGEHFLTASSVQFDLDLSSLLAGEVRLTALRMNMPSLYLRRNASGRWNWPTLLEDREFRPAPQADAPTVSPDRGSEAGRPAPLSLINWSVRSGTLFIEGPDGKTRQIRDFDLELTDIDSAFPFPVSLRIPFGDGYLAVRGYLGPVDRVAPWEAPIQAEVEVSNLSLSSLEGIVSVPESMGGLQLDGRIHLETAGEDRFSGQLQLRSSTSKRQALVSLGGRYDRKLKRLRFDQSSLGLELARLLLEGDLRLGDDGGFNFKILPEKTTVRHLLDLASLFGQLYPKSAERLPEAKAELEKSVVGGSLEIRQEAGDGFQFGFDLQTDRLDLDLWRTLYSGAPTAISLAAAAAAEEQPAESLLKRARGQGKLAATQLFLGTLTFDRVSVAVRLQQGILTARPLKADFYSGAISGNVSLDFRGDPARTRFTGELAGVDANRLLSTLSESKDLLFGSLEGRLDLQLSGGGEEAIQSARGEVRLQLTEAKLAHLNLSRKLATVAQLAGQPLAGHPTTIEEISATFRVADGWARTEDLKLRSGPLELVAMGGFSFRNQLDLRATAVFSPEASRLILGRAPAGGLLGTVFTDREGRVWIPVTITGTFSNPDFRPDIARLAEMKLQELGGRWLDDLLKRDRKP